MKVEFLDNDVLGAELLISASEFVKAKNNEREYDSLVHATAAFANLLGLDYQISEDEFDAVIARLDKTGAVIFTIGESQYPTRRWCEICVSNNNQLEKIAYEDEDGWGTVIFVVKRNAPTNGCVPLWTTTFGSVLEF